MATSTNKGGSRPNADEKRKAGQPKYQPVEQADDEEIAQSQRQSRSTNPADEVPIEASGEDQEDNEMEDSETEDEEWMDEDGNDVTSEERLAEEGSDEDSEEGDSNETSGGRRPGKRKGSRGGDSPRP